MNGEYHLEGARHRSSEQVWAWAQSTKLDALLTREHGSYCNAELRGGLHDRVGRHGVDHRGRGRRRVDDEVHVVVGEGRDDVDGERRLLRAMPGVRGETREGTRERT